VIEYLQGNGGYLISHEVFLYVFDSMLMAGVMGIFLIWYVEQLESKTRPANPGHHELRSSDTSIRLSSHSQK
jgi:hypothetical protein